MMSHSLKDLSRAKKSVSIDGTQRSEKATSGNQRHSTEAENDFQFATSLYDNDLYLHHF